jgi:hypothetical protein
VASDSDEDNTMLCPEPDCGETILLIELNEHLDLHTAEKLPLEEDPSYTKYHQRHHSGSMKRQSSSVYSSPSFAEQQTFNAETPNAQPQHEQRSRRRRRANSNTSVKTSITRSILAFNPFARSNKKICPPRGENRLGVSSRTCRYSSYG